MAKKKDAGTQPEEKSNGPMKMFRVEDVSASIFSSEHNGRTFYNVSFTRSYKNGSGEYRYTHYFGLEDLGKVVTVAQQASEYLHSLNED